MKISPYNTPESEEGEFLITLFKDGLFYDLYFKDTEIEKTIIARYGDDDRYISGWGFGKRAYEKGNFTNPLAVAYVLVKDRNDN